MPRPLPIAPANLPGNVPVVALLGLTLAACDGKGGGSLAACAGTYEGGFEGDAHGQIEVELSADGAFEATFFTVESGDLATANGLVADDGEVVGDDPDVEFVGQFDFSDCNASGTWASLFGVGTWWLDPLEG